MTTDELSLATFLKTVPAATRKLADTPEKARALADAYERSGVPRVGFLSRHLPKAERQALVREARKAFFSTYLV